MKAYTQPLEAPPFFAPYKLVIEVTTPQTHDALTHMAMADLRIPTMLQKDDGVDFEVAKALLQTINWALIKRKAEQS